MVKPDIVCDKTAACCVTLSAILTCSQLRRIRGRGGSKRNVEAGRREYDKDEDGKLSKAEFWKFAMDNRGKRRSVKPAEISVGAFHFDMIFTPRTLIPAKRFPNLEASSRHTPRL